MNVDSNLSEDLVIEQFLKFFGTKGFYFASISELLPFLILLSCGIILDELKRFVESKTAVGSKQVCIIYQLIIVSFLTVTLRALT